MTQHALSLKQPWAALLVHGLKTVDIRRWGTDFRGPVLIHAARVDDDRPEIWARVPPEVRATTELRGGIIGAATLVDCQPYRTEEAFRRDVSLHLNEPGWFQAGLYGMHFRDLRPIPFRRYPGWFRIFEVEPAEACPERPRGKKGATQPAEPAPALPPAGSGTGLLVSVRSALEVEAALAGGATLIDVKEPGNGPLGRPRPQTVREVVAAVAGRALVSAAQGEYAEETAFQGNGSVPALVPGCDLVKWGPAGLGDVDSLRRAHDQARAVVEEALPGCQVVLVAYADSQAAHAPPLEEVCALACQRPGSVLLIDTFQKKPAAGSAVRPNLLDFVPSQRLGLLCRLCRASGVRLALAGSLGRAHIEQLLPLQPDWFAVRGAACAGADRSGPVQEPLVRALADLIRKGQPLSPPGARAD